MKNILLLVHKDAGQEARLQAALDLTRALKGHLTCLDVVQVYSVDSDFQAAYAQSVMFTGEQAREAKNRERIEARLANEDVPWNWLDATGDIAIALKDAAGMADLIVVNRELDDAFLPDMRAIAGEVTISSGRAVVAVPQHGRGFQVDGRALVAWDGSAEAQNALHSALPLLRLARDVTIFEIKDHAVEKPAEEAASYLARHDISALIVRRRAGITPTAAMLLTEAATEKASYIVMGGFGHSRFVEAVFGGVTREMLGESPVPLVLAH